ncbi:hypothetical protein J4573_40920 [Actinomadura barringtoniae]|uniref:DUF998 domain-containing protein n=1 Tax=Actinomadura barringtoniae TaxID=1427535 RepID=A0A939PJM2_9ACTN|nr:hypothetical protein [Actinomadura barringtoniae]MBO2453512.1 hypothetical protein [Actinomadura barringtoniae]
MVDLRSTPHRWRPVLGLLLLAPLVGEYLLGNTPVTDFGSLPLYLPLYGCGALLIREVARRTGHGWPTMLLLGAAYGLWEEGPVDQMLWNPRYGGFDFGLTYAGTHVPFLGTSVALLQDVVSMHMIWSICVPIALVEAFRRDRQRPWLGRVGLAITALVLAAGSAGLAAIQYAANGHFMASAWQWTVGLVLIGGLILAAFLVPRVPKRQGESAAPSPWLAGCAAFALTSAYWVGQAVLRDRVSDWVLVIGWLALAAIAVAVGISWSHCRGWGAQHRAAVAVGALLTYVWVGFTHASDMGVSLSTALIGNIIFGTGALVLAAAALRSASSTDHAANSTQPAA